MTENQRLTLARGAATLDVWTLGARLNNVSWDGFDDLVDGSASEDEARGAKLNHGSVAGPVANRIAGGAAKIDGTPYQFETNENGKTLLHSGGRSTRDALWRIEHQAKAEATLVLDIADLADGFPGNRRLTAVYTVDDNGFTLRFEATTDAPTLINLALHPYWRLDAGGRDGLALQVKADRYLPIDADKIPTGEVATVTGAFDLLELRVPSDQIDHNFCIGPDGPQVTLASDRLKLDIETDAPGLQIFTGKPIGIAIEPQHWPDAPHHGHFPSILLRPGDTYRQTSRYRFSRL